MPAMTQNQTPRVQIPLSADYHGLSIDGEFVYAWPEEQEHPGDEDLHPRANQYLPERANEAYWNYYGTDNLGRVYQCTHCSYLTMSTKARVSAYKKHKCTNCGRQSWRHVYPDPVNEANELDVLALEPEQVPNATSHLSRIQNQLESHVTRNELFDIVADAVADARQEGHVPY